MSIVLDIKPEVQAELSRQAAAHGRAVESYAASLLEEAVRPTSAAVTNADEIRAVNSPSSVFEQGLGLFSSPEDAALLDEVVSVAYQERRRPSKRGADALR